jgi:hypothetical protein
VQQLERDLCAGFSVDEEAVVRRWLVRTAISDPDQTAKKAIGG